MSKIGIIDADLIASKKAHRFPNLCSMKISSFHKEQGDTVDLLLSYDLVPLYDLVYISKVFTATEVPEHILTLPNVSYGGTGFFYDTAPPLPYEIEHSKPDYHLYDDFINGRINDLGEKKQTFQYYTDFSIGYLTRGCFRHCEFCVNKNSLGSKPASPLNEFMDESRPKLCFLDDNFFACPQWRKLIEPVKNSGKRFEFKQGLDERLLTADTIREMGGWKYEKDFIFAFDHIEDAGIITRKLMLFRYLLPDNKRKLKFYLFCGYDRTGKYDQDFWRQDIINLFERIRILRTYGALGYVMRYYKAYDSPFASIYTSAATWCAVPQVFLKCSFSTFCMKKGVSRTYHPDPPLKDGEDLFERYLKDGGKKGKPWTEMEKFSKIYPEIADRYFHFWGQPQSKYEWLDDILE